MALYVIFWDGVGYGRKDAEVNPFFSARLPALRALCGEDLFSLHRRRVFTPLASIVPVNATLGVAGLPQSGTGQTALFTGVNAPRVIGSHFGPYPYSTLVPIIREKNIFRQLHALGASFRFVNGFPRRYIEYLTAHAARTPVVALAYASVTGALHTHLDVHSGTAISADIIGGRWKELGHGEIREVAPESAGETFYRIGIPFDFVLFEYFITDKAGHTQHLATAIDALERLDRFIDGILARFDFRRDTLLLISDHGNIEDLTTKSHTRNPVPLIVAGRNKDFFSASVRRLTDLTPAIVASLSRR
jgi:2,3-bisphosphoglycerate-independent phosphoglycerate mutase